MIFNNDGSVDIVASEFSTSADYNHLRLIFWEIEDNEWEYSELLNMGHSNIELRDIDQNGFIDIFGFGRTIYDEIHNIFIHYQDDEIEFETVLLLEERNEFIYKAGISDLDRDNHNDIITLSQLNLYFF